MSHQPTTVIAETEILVSRPQHGSALSTARLAQPVGAAPKTAERGPKPAGMAKPPTSDEVSGLSRPTASVFSLSTAGARPIVHSGKQRARRKDAATTRVQGHVAATGSILVGAPPHSQRGGPCGAPRSLKAVCASTNSK